MAIQSTPPIQLDPSMDNGHQLAFINQNFQSIANVLQQNSFVIVAKPTFVSDPYSTIAHGSSVQAVETTTLVNYVHNLNYAPIPQVYLSDGTGTNTIFPISHGSVYLANIGINAWQQWVFDIVISPTRLLINIDHYYAANASGTIGAFGPVTFNITAYLLQQTLS